MKFRGLFVGVDRYQDVAVPWLAGAARDARALHALFADTLGDGGALLADERATTAAIRIALETLASESSADDIVVFFFYAGHGSDDHFLVSYDAEFGRVPESCLSLDDVAELVSAIPGQMLLCVLDCCFSGGLGSRVLASGLRTRGTIGDPVAKALGRFVGSGRLALTASAADEEALESPRHGHGLLTFRLLQALQGTADTTEGDKLSLLKVIDYVTRSVQGDAAQMGRKQTPTLRGQLDGALVWPILTPGPRFKALFPERVRPPATSDPMSLEPFGLSQDVLDTWVGSISALNDLQVAAVNDFGVLDGESLVVTAPTSSGKTMIGELAALQHAAHRHRATFLLPMRALVNDKYEYFRRVYGSVGLKTIRATGEHSDDVPAFLRGQFDVALLTYEKYSALALGNPHVLDLAAVVVVDEAQILADASRGSNLEFLMTLLNNKRGRTGSPQVLTLSAVVGDLGGLDRWLGAGHLHTDVRPVPLVEGVIDHAGSLRFLDEDGAEQTTNGFIQPLYTDGSRRLLIPVARKLMAEGKKVLVFRQSKGEAVACSVYLSQSLGLAPAQRAVDEITGGDISTSTRTLQATLAAGVAFHNADLDRDERRIVEDEFRDPDSPLRVVVATPTLAMGVNTPASAVAIVGLTHPGRVPSPYSVAEYKNMVGRAGRLGLTPRGESYLIPEGNLDAHRAWTLYVNGTLESLRSQLVPDGDPRSLMLRVIASYPPDAVGIVSEADVLGFLDSSFAAFQARDGGGAQWTPDLLQSGFNQLVSASLIEADGGGYRLTNLGRFTGESGVHVDSILRLVLGLRGSLALNSVGLVAAAQMTNELDDIYIPVNAKAKNTEVPRWPNLLAQQQVPGSVIRALQMTAGDIAQAVSRCKRAAAAAMWMSGMPIEAIELNLTQHLRQRGGVAGAVRGIADRTRDLLPSVAAVIREVGQFDGVDRLVERTMLRLEFGLPAEVVGLVSQLDVALTRAQWVSLKDADLASVDKLRTEPQDRLTETLRSKTAATRLSRAVADWSTPVESLDPLLPVPAE